MFWLVGTRRRKQELEVRREYLENIQRARKV